jgi:hypothetical protein
MSAVKGGIYQRGEFWLDYVRGARGDPASERLYIWWYAPKSGRLERQSTRTSDVRIACDKLDEHFLAVHRPTPREQESYTVSEAMTDYWLEHGSKQTSSEAIKSRLKLMSRYLDAEADAGRLADPFLPELVDKRFLERFRAWAVADPIVARKKDGQGNWVDGKSRPRTASTAEESIIQLKAALNHAFNERRIRYVPPIKHKTRDQVTPQRNYRLSVDGLAEMFDYTMRGAGNYAGHADRLLPMRRYLVGAVCTLGRPDAIFDMNVLRERGQWMQNERRFALNPEGRLQTKKARPILPVTDLLHEWLTATDDWLVCRERHQVDELTEEVEVIQLRAMSIRSAWETARLELKLPPGWGPKLIRHSMATILLNRRVNPVELEIAMGHRPLSKTTGRYAIFDPDYLASIRDGIEDVVGDLTRMAGPALHAKNMCQDGFTRKKHAKPKS